MIEPLRFISGKIERPNAPTGDKSEFSPALCSLPKETPPRVSQSGTGGLRGVRQNDACSSSSENGVWRHYAYPSSNSSCVWRTCFSDGFMRMRDAGEISRDEKPTERLHIRAHDGDQREQPRIIRLFCSTPLDQFNPVSSFIIFRSILRRGSDVADA